MYPPPTTTADLIVASVHDGLDRVHVRQTAEREDPLVVRAGDRRADRLGAGAQDQNVIGLFVFPVFGLVVDHHGLGLAIDADDLAAGADIDGKTLTHRLRTLDQEPGPVRDDAAKMVGKATVGKGDVAAAFEQNDLGVLAHASGLGRRRRSPRHSTHDHDALTLTHTYSSYTLRLPGPSGATNIRAMPIPAISPVSSLAAAWGGFTRTRIESGR